MSEESRPIVYFVRHGQSEANASGVLAGDSESPLTDLGRMQAQQEAKLIIESDIKFNRIITTHLSRARETAEIIAKGIGFAVDNIEVSESLSERNVGQLEGKPVAMLDKINNDSEAERFNSEKNSLFAERIHEANIAIDLQQNDSVLIVGHSGGYRMALCLALGLDSSFFNRVPNPNNAELLIYPLQG